MAKYDFDYSYLRAEIIRQYGTVKAFCEKTKVINESHLCRIMSNQLKFSQGNILIIANTLGIDDFKKYFFTPKV